jgi:hypothetical protein
MIKALIFDVDGTLAEAEEGHRQAFNAAFAEAGLGWAWDVDLYRELYNVTGGRERMRHCADLVGLSADALSDADIVELHRRKNAHYAEIVRAGQCPLRPGVERLILRARARGLRLAISTTNQLAGQCRRAHRGDARPGRLWLVRGHRRGGGRLSQEARPRRLSARTRGARAATRRMLGFRGLLEWAPVRPARRESRPS